MNKKNVKNGMFLKSKGNHIFKVIRNNTLKECYQGWEINLNQYDEYMVCELDSYSIVGECPQPIVENNELNGKKIKSKYTNKLFRVYFGTEAYKRCDGGDILFYDGGAGNRSHSDSYTYVAYYILSEKLEKIYLGQYSMESGKVLNALLVGEYGEKFVLDSNYVNMEFELVK